MCLCNTEQAIKKLYFTAYMLLCHSQYLSGQFFLSKLQGDLLLELPKIISHILILIITFTH